MPRLGHDIHPEKINLNSVDRSFSQVVCVCEQVTAGEIEAALTARVPAKSIDGVRKRTGACGGRCQGAPFCKPPESGSEFAHQVSHRQRTIAGEATQ